MNGYTTGYQGSPAACCNATGDFVVVWAGQGMGPDLITNFIFGRRFAARGVPVSDDFQVNTYTAGIETYPTLSCGPGGTFVVSWSQFPEQPNSAEDGSGGGVFARRFAPLQLSPTPTLSWLGLAAAVVALLGAGRRAFRRWR